MHRLIDVLQRLTDAGNTVLVIEHNLNVIKVADYLIDLGKEGGTAGGTLVVSGTKFTGRLFKAAITKYLAHRKEKKLQKQKSRDTPVIPHGKQTVKQLIGQNQGVSNIEITDPSIKEFEKIARKYGVDYAVKKDRSSSPPKYLIFFKGRDADALTAAFTEYTGKKVKKAEKSERPSVLAKLSQFKELVKHAVVDRNKRKELER